jgi:hypothetical protein
VFSGVVFMVIVATLVTPPLLRLTYRDDATDPGRQSAAGVIPFRIEPYVLHCFPGTE